MAAGAVEIITKPTSGLKNFLLESAPELISAIRAAAQVNVKNLGKRPAPAPLTPATKLTADAMLPAANGHAMAQTTERIVALGTRSEEHTSELQSLMRLSYAVFCLKKKKQPHNQKHTQTRPQ